MYICCTIYKKYFILLGESLLISCERESNNDKIVKIENSKEYESGFKINSVCWIGTHSSRFCRLYGLDIKVKYNGMLELSNREILLVVLFLVGLVMNIFDMCKNNKNRKSIKHQYSTILYIACIINILFKQK